MLAEAVDTPRRRRTSRADWIEEGFRVLAAEGHAGLTVDLLCERLGRTKGSFYHHFEGRPGYVRAVLEEWERRATDRLIETWRIDGSVEERLRAVNREAAELRNARLERAIRSWAAREPEAERIQDRVDRRRLAFLEELCAERMGAGDAACRVARVLQLVFVGAQHLEPPLEGPELYRAFASLDPLFRSGAGAANADAPTSAPRDAVPEPRSSDPAPAEAGHGRRGRRLFRLRRG